MAITDNETTTTTPTSGGRITDELREWFKDRFFMANGWQELHDIADRIDAALAERYVELPKDADGEYVHIGDRMESGDGDMFIVSSVDYGLHSSHGRGKFWMLWNEDAEFYERAYECRHHKQPTVEDVLREMADRCYADEDEPRDRDAIVAEYAAKLREMLAGDAE